MDDALMKCDSPRIHARTLPAATLPLTACCSIQREERCSTLSADAKTWKPASFGPLVIQRGVLRKINFACCVQCALGRALDTRSRRKRWPRWNVVRAKLRWSLASEFGTNSPGCSPRAMDG